MTRARTLTYHGEPVPAPDLARRKNVPVSTLLSRIDRLGWSVERAADTPADRRFRRGGRRKKDAPRPCPELREHPTSGLAYCRWSVGGKRDARYFGKWGTPEANQAYRRFAAEWATLQGPPPKPSVGRLTVAKLVTRFTAYAVTRYQKRGQPTSELSLYRSACRSWVALYGQTPAAEFKPSGLRALRDHWVRDGLARETANRYAAKVIKVLAWGVGQDGLVPAAVLGPLREVEPLVAGSTAAPEPEPVASVPWPTIAATLPHLGASNRGPVHPYPERQPILEAMVRLQVLARMRPGELCAMRPEFVERDRTPWRYDTRHANKTLHRDKPRVVYFGPRAREILGPVIDQAEPGRPLWTFPPLRGPGRTPVTRLEYCRWVGKACRRAGVEPWNPMQLRHRGATDVYERYEDHEAVAAALGNTPEVARQVYIDNPGEAVARRIAEATG